eukprot:658360-Rhodomonas_salina.1
MAIQSCGFNGACGDCTSYSGEFMCSFPSRDVERGGVRLCGRHNSREQGKVLVWVVLFAGCCGDDRKLDLVFGVSEVVIDVG